MPRTDSFAQAREEHRKLGEEIAAHDRAYYQDDAPKISDADYDALRRDLPPGVEPAYDGLTFAMG